MPGSEKKKARDRARMRAKRAAEGWQPIDTAPMDGTTLLLFCPKGDGSEGSTYRVTAGFWEVEEGYIKEHRDLEGRWIGQDEKEPYEWWCTLDGGFSEDTMMPTHWMPMPSIPKPSNTPTT